MARTHGIEWEALKVVLRGKSLSKSYGIRKKLDHELIQQEDALVALQRQVDNGDASESDCLAVRGRIEDLWGRLDNQVRLDFRQWLFREGDHSGRLLAWLLRREHPDPHHPDALRTFWEKYFRTVTTIYICKST
ncbi:hypothetical protein NDU88_004517 [Pleurodeles waltl]|uniref:Uncharacterized protein n=1 Tax=Pleurodeles waltl TaxID=8319 RepID=A0AAV7RGG6_PLEWA|nr:hypothetical protein NDU88_004517 [Pleurodeles waltl]